MPYLRENSYDKQDDSKIEVSGGTAFHLRTKHKTDTRESHRYTESVDDRDFLFEKDEGSEHRKYRDGSNDHCTDRWGARLLDAVSLTKEINQWLKNGQ